MPVRALLVAALVLPLAPASAPEIDLAWSNADSPAGGFVNGLGGSSAVLVAVMGDAAFRSVNGGVRWERVTGFPDAVEGRVAFDPTNPFVGYVAGYGGLARTTDGGVTWTEAFDSNAVYRVAVAPSGRVAIAPAVDFQLKALVSDDRGATWQDWAAPLPQFSSAYGLEFGRHDGELAVMNIADLWVTHDGGASWTKTAGGGGRDLVRDLDGSLWRAGWSTITRSTDGGATWTATAAPASGILGARPDGGVVVASSAGVLVSRDGGASWTNMGFGDATFGATAVMADPADPNAVLMSDEFVGIARIAPAPGGGWSYSTRTTGLAPVHIESVGASADGSLLLAGGWVGAYASRDGGSTWSHIGAGAGMLSTRAVAANADGSVVYAGGDNRIFQPFVASSRDGGATFTVALPNIGGDGYVRAIAAHPATPMRAALVAGGGFTLNHVFETLDGGLTWTSIFSAKFQLHDVAWHATSGGLLVAGEIGTLLISDGVVTPRLVATSNFAVASAGDVAYSGGIVAPVWRAEGVTAAFTPWVPDGPDVRDLAIAATGGVWAVTDAGAVVRCDDPAPATCVDASPPVAAQKVLEAAGRVLAATGDAGLHSTPLPTP